MPQLEAALKSSHVVMHPWVIGELACGKLRHRAQALQLLQGLPAATVASDGEVLLLLDQEQLMGRGIGYVDAHLLASARRPAAGSGARIMARHLDVAAPDCPP